MLKDLTIRKCPMIDASFPRGLWPPKLVTLKVGELKNPISEWGYQNFPACLIDLWLYNEPRVRNFSQLSDLFPSSLNRLCIQQFEKLESLSMGLQHLTSLQHLVIWTCPKMMYLPETLLPSLLSADAIEFVICHAEVTIAFADEKKICKLNANDVYLSFLPLAHIFDRLIEECFFNHGASIGFWRGDIKMLSEDIGELKPTIFCVVPRVLERIYSGLQQKISTGGFIKRNLFNLAYSYKVKGRVRIILSGGAPLAPHVEAYLKVVTCSHVLQGEYVAVEYLEIVYGLVPDIDAVWIYGNSFESCLVGVVNPYKQAIEHYAETHNISGDFDSLCVNPMIKEYILGELMMCTTHPHPHPHPHPKPTSEKTHVQDSCACIVSFYLFPFLKVFV
ncbi:putative long-chain-fatty-acid--CoA ligase [Helianthus debilis subsp. tardiflorus]